MKLIFTMEKYLPTEVDNVASKRGWREGADGEGGTQDFGWERGQ